MAIGIVPQCGQLVIVRSRPAIVREIRNRQDPNTSENMNYVMVEYIDGWNYPPDDALVWEREAGARILSKVMLPNISSIFTPDSPGKFDAFVNALRWSSIGKVPVKAKLPECYDAVELISPWESAVQIEDYQIYPVMKALAMPRTTMLIADDVGVGKTVEAGLITSELISQRRIRRILIICPATLQLQWRDEMKSKFNLDFRVIDGTEAFNIQREMGMDANPWVSTPRIITSMDYLRQPGVRDKFLAGAQNLTPKGSASMPYDLLIVDEAHNLSPNTYGDDSLRCQMLRDIGKYFEHRLFLSATPHNGFTISFTGLLELLDPLRFQQKPSLDERDHAQIQAVMVRRLKSELNKKTAIPRFTDRHVEAIPLSLSPGEKELYNALRTYRSAVLKMLRKVGKKERNLGRFIFSLLTKRLLSSSYAFARTWWRHVEGYNLEEFGYIEAEKSASKADEEVGEDFEKDRRESDAVRHGAAWLRTYKAEFLKELESVSTTLNNIGWTKDIVYTGLDNTTKLPPDSKWDSLIMWISDKMIANGRLRNDERLIIFTEYKDSQDYLLWRLRTNGLAEPSVMFVYGGIDLRERSEIRREFNDPDSRVRILVATDTAREGLDLHICCRYVVHQDIPWNPMRLEQRNGRLDRHGQSRDVYVYHFTSNDDYDIQFLDYVARKVDSVRDDLGSAGQVLDEAINEHFSYRKLDVSEVDRRLEIFNNNAPAKNDLQWRQTGTEEEYSQAIQHLRATEYKLGLNEQSLAQLLRHALRMENGDLEETAEKGFYRIRYPASWEGIVNSSLKIRRENTSALPKLVFNPDHLIVSEHGRKVFRVRADTVLIRLGHPVMRKAVSVLRRRLWDEQGKGAMNRWTITSAMLPESMDIIAVIYCIVSVRNKLGETMYGNVVEMPFQLFRNNPGEISPELWAQISRLEASELTPEQLTFWKPHVSNCWSGCYNNLDLSLARLKTKVALDFQTILAGSLEEQIESEKSVYEARIRELDTEKSSKSVEKLRKELLVAENVKKQLTFNEEVNRENEERYNNLLQTLSEAEWQRQYQQITALKQYLISEEKRIVEKVLPQRCSVATVDVQPAAVKIIVRRD